MSLAGPKMGGIVVARGGTIRPNLSMVSMALPIISIDRTVMMNAAKELEDGSRKLASCQRLDLEPNSMPAELSTFSRYLSQAQSVARNFMSAECSLLSRTAEQTRLPAIQVGIADFF